jgi:D-arabinose 1-dehydrogenase-like Zn-dependent alcohol dehydrogenase
MVLRSTHRRSGWVKSAPGGSTLMGVPAGRVYGSRGAIFRLRRSAGQDGLDFLKIVPQAGIRTQTTVFPLAEANDVLSKLRTGQIPGAAVLKP